MLDTDDKFIIILVILNIISFFIGYILGKNRIIQNIGALEHSSLGIKQKKKENINNISIDETKVVSKINTDGLEKRYDKLGDKKESQENITTSINKLKNMKG